MTAPVIAKEEEVAYTDPFDDIFGSAPTSPAPDGEENLSRQAQLVDPSDIPRLRSTHVTNGYRDGIAAGKENSTQPGFDEGYPLGAEFGIARGWCLGVLEGMFEAMVEDPTVLASSDVSTSEQSDGHLSRERVRAMLVEAEEELSTRCLLGNEYFGEDGVWTYDVPGQVSEDEVTFRKVAAAHPLVKKWTKIVIDLAASLGLELQ